MNLEQLTEGMPELVEITGNAQTVIGTLTADSRAKCDAGLFFASGAARSMRMILHRRRWQTVAARWSWSASWRLTARRWL